MSTTWYYYVLLRGIDDILWYGVIYAMWGGSQMGILN